MKVLAGEKRIFFDQVLKDVITDTALALRRPDTGFFEGLGDALRSWTVDSDATRGDAAEVLTLEECRKDAG
jgi:hypothetical protein